MPVKFILKSFLSILILSAGIISCDTKEKGSLVNPSMAPSAQPVQQPVQQSAPATGNAMQAQPSGINGQTES